jgi:putative ABC transport system substrate-binding protein
MKRRAFIFLLGGTALAWPLAARGQQPTHRIGMLIGYSENDPEIQARLAAFRQALETNGWKEGGNVRIDYRFAPASTVQAQVSAKELIALQPDVLVGNSTPATAALLQETRTIPIVFVGVSDPVGSHFVASIARPSGSATASLISRHRWSESGSKCSSRSRRVSRERQSYSIPKLHQAGDRFSSNRSRQQPARLRLSR